MSWLVPDSRSTLPSEKTLELAAQLHQLGRMRLDEGRSAEALRLLEQADTLGFDAPALLEDLARARAVAGDVIGAADAARRRIAVEPDSAEALAIRGWAALASGRFDLAEASWRAALIVEPQRAELYLGLARLGVLDDTESIDSQLERAELSGDDRLDLLFARAEVLSYRGTPQAAFAAVDRANRAVGSHYEVSEREELVQRVRAASPREVLLGGGGCPSAGPIFVTGLARSGATLVQRILSAHPRVQALDDRCRLGDLSKMLMFSIGRGFPEGVAALDNHTTSVFAQRYLDAAGVGAKAPYFVDRTLSGCATLGLAARLFPSAQVVYVRRDPRDVALSSYFTWFGRDRYTYSYDLQHIAAHLRTHEALMEHWREELPLPIHVVDYEELVCGGEAAQRRLIEAVGLPWDPACAHPGQGGVCLTSSAVQVRRPIYQSSIGRWRDHVDRLGPILEQYPMGPDSTGQSAAA